MAERDLQSDSVEAAAVIDALQVSLSQREFPRDFSDQSLEALLRCQAEFIEELGLEAIRNARRARADVVSATDVERADELVRGGSRGRRLAGAEALGGVLAGAGVGEFIDVLSDSEPSSLAIALPAVLMVVGAILMTAALLRR